ncbi:MAG: alanine racemase [Firmicutes bacterium]|nr:alanine racemase [Bacillota bacterium]
MGSPFHQRPTRAEIDLDCIEHNLNELCRLLGPDVAIMAVVKADGYGHGAVEVARVVLEAGASWLGVALIDEGAALRRAGIDAPILLLGHTDPADSPQLLEYRLTPTVCDLETAGLFSRYFSSRSRRWPVHLKIDTGMGRLGVSPAESIELMDVLSRLPGLELEGVFTHLSSADDEAGAAYTAEQLSLFESALAGAGERGVHPPLCHAANSAAALLYPQSRYNLVRIGIALYGYYPSPWVQQKAAVKLEPAMLLKSKISFLKKVPPQTPLSYGRTFHTAKDTVVATVSAGYADGYQRALSNRGEVLVRGRRAPVVGRICMDQLMIDVSGIEGAAPGDEVILYGGRGPEHIAVEEVAALLGTINYELLCNVGTRVPRSHIRTRRAGTEQENR